MTDATQSARDFVASRWMSFLLWRAPAIVMVAAGFLDLDAALRGWIWTGCLGIFSGGCISNALRCGRMHCYFTGPFFGLMALASLLHGFGIVSLGPRGWMWIGSLTLIGGAALWYLPEQLWGKYAGRETT